MEVWVISGAIVGAAAIISSSIHQAGKLVADRIDNHSRISDEMR